MPNDEHLAKLKEGVEAWNQWRESNPSIQLDLREADLSHADLSGANLSGSALRAASLVGSDLRNADLTGCSVYGISVWNTKLDGAKQSNLLITGDAEPAIRVDDLEVAQFTYLLLSNAKIRHVIDTITSKVVLIPGAFHARAKSRSRRNSRGTPQARLRTRFV